MIADRQTHTQTNTQTDRHTHHNTSLIGGGVTIKQTALQTYTQKFSHMDNVSESLIISYCPVNTM